MTARSPTSHLRISGPGLQLFLTKGSNSGRFSSLCTQRICIRYHLSACNRSGNTSGISMTIYDNTEFVEPWMVCSSMPSARWPATMPSSWEFDLIRGKFCAFLMRWKRLANSPRLQQSASVHCFSVFASWIASPGSTMEVALANNI